MFIFHYMTRNIVFLLLFFGANDLTLNKLRQFETSCAHSFTVWCY